MAMQLQQIYELMERFKASGLGRLEWKTEQEKIVLEKAAPAPVLAAPAAAPVAVAAAPAAADGQSAQAEAAPAAAPAGETVDAPVVGTFYAAAAPDQPAYVTPGQQVKQGETLCLIEAMKMMNEVAAPADCVIEEALVQNGAVVGFGQPLFRIRRV